MKYYQQGGKVKKPKPLPSKPKVPVKTQMNPGQQGGLLSSLSQYGKENSDMLAGIGNLGTGLEGMISGGYNAQYKGSGLIDTGLDVLSMIPGGQVFGAAGKLVKGVVDGFVGKKQRIQEEQEEARKQVAMNNSNSLSLARANMNPNYQGNRLSTIYQTGGSTYVAKPELILPKPNPYTGTIMPTKKGTYLNPMKQSTLNKMNNARTAEENKALLGKTVEYATKLLDPTTISNAADTYVAWKQYNQEPTWNNLGNAMQQSAYHIPVLGKAGKALNTITKGIDYTNKGRYTLDTWGKQQGGNINAINGGTDIDTSSTGQVFKGNTHSEGGIDIAKGMQPIAEVENGEVQENVNGQPFIFSNILLNPQTKRMFAQDALEVSMQKGELEDKGNKLADKIGKRKFISEEAKNGLKIYEQAIEGKNRTLAELASLQEQVKEQTMQAEANTPEAQIGLSNGGQRMEFNNVSPGQTFEGRTDRPILIQLGTDEGDYFNIKDTKVLNPGETMTVPNNVNKVVEQKMKYGGKLKYQTGIPTKKGMLDIGKLDRPNFLAGMPIESMGITNVMPQTNLSEMINSSDIAKSQRMGKFLSGLNTGVQTLGKIAPSLLENADIAMNAALIGKEPKYPMQALTSSFNPTLKQANVSPINQAYRVARKSLANTSSQNQNIQLMNLASKQAQDVANEYARTNMANIDLQNQAQMNNLDIQTRNNAVIQNNMLQRALQRTDQLSQWKQLASQVSGRSQQMNRDKRAEAFDLSQVKLITDLLKKQKGGKLKKLSSLC